MKMFIEPTWEITISARMKANDFHLRDLMISSMKPKNLVTALLHCLLKNHCNLPHSPPKNTRTMNPPVAPWGLEHNCFPSWCHRSRQGKSAHVEDRRAGRPAEPDMQNSCFTKKKETVRFCLILILWHRMCSRSILGRGELWAEPGKHKNEFSWMEVQLGEIGGRGANLSTFDKLKKREGSNCCVDISGKTWDEGPKPRVPSVPSRLGRM